ncbi:hypothetical protein PG984_010661 [Apiospora sp. TS-2023a]
MGSELNPPSDLKRRACVSFRRTGFGGSAICVCLVHVVHALIVADREHALAVRIARLTGVRAGTHGRCLTVSVVTIVGLLAHRAPVVGLGARGGSSSRRSSRGRRSGNDGGHRLVQETGRVYGYAEAQGAALRAGDARAAEAALVPAGGAGAALLHAGGGEGGQEEGGYDGELHVDYK